MNWIEEHEATADEIAKSRPPDDYWFGDWEDDPDSEVVTKYMVPVAGSLLLGFTYKEVIEVTHTRYRRMVVEKWYVKSGYKPVYKPITADWATDATEATPTFDVEYLPGKTVARKHWEYKSAVA